MLVSDAHAGTRLPGRERDLLPPETSIEVLAEHAEGLVALSGCARQGLGVVDPTGVGLDCSKPDQHRPALGTPRARGQGPQICGAMVGGFGARIGFQLAIDTAERFHHLGLKARLARQLAFDSARTAIEQIARRQRVALGLARVRGPEQAERKVARGFAATGDGNYLLTPKAEAIAEALKDLPARQRQLDVVQLHRIILDKLLGLDQETITRLGNVRYIREADEAISLVANNEADIAFLIKPITLDQLRDVSLSGDVMPQKSTDFYPKLLSGLAIYALD